MYYNVCLYSYFTKILNIPISNTCVQNHFATRIRKNLFGKNSNFTDYGFEY